MSSDLPTPTRIDTLYLGNLSIVSTKSDVANAIREQGFDDFVIKFRYKDRKQCKYCFATFSTVEKCQEAYGRLLGRFSVRGRSIRVRYGGHRIADATQGNVPIYSVHFRFCTTLEFIDESTVTIFFVDDGNVVDVCITEIEKVKLPVFT